MSTLLLLAVLPTLAQIKMQVTGECSQRLDTLLVYELSSQKMIDKVKTNGGKFAYKLNGKEMGVYGIGNNTSVVPFFCDGTDLWIDCINHQVKGSPLNVTFSACDQRLDSIDSKVQGRLLQLAMSGAEQSEMEAKAAEMLAKRSKDRIAVLEQYRNTMIPAAYLPDECHGMSYEELSKWLDPEAPYYKHPNMEIVKRFMASLEKKHPGKMFTDLTMNDLEGKSRSLSEWCGKGNYVLIDFWASWCAPCRREMPNVVASYVKYHKKGYEVIGVSFDNKDSSWKAAVKQLGMDWIQLSDLKGWESAASEAYGVMSIPSNVLLDPEGRIVASDLRGAGLERKLQEIYGF